MYRDFFPGKGTIFFPSPWRPDRLWDSSPRFLFSKYRELISEDKAAVPEASYSPPSNG